MIHNDPKWSKMIHNGQKWSEMALNIPKWSEMVKIVQHSQNGPYFAKTFLNLSKIVKILPN